MTTPASTDAPASAESAAPQQTAPDAPSPGNMPQHVPPAQAAAEPADSDEAAREERSAAKARREASNLRDRLHQEQQAGAETKKSLDELRAKQAEHDEWRGKFAALFNPEADKPLTVEQMTEQYADERAQWDLKSTELTTQIEAKEAQLRELAIERATERAARSAGVDPDALLDSRSFLSAAAKFDPASDSFMDDLASAIQSAAETNPKLKLAPVAKRSGAEIPGGNGGSGRLTREQATELAKKDPEAADKLRRSGQLKHLGIG